MKKLFTLACGLVLAMGASAAEFGFCDKDGKLFDNGATVSVGYEADELIPGVLTIYEMQSGVYYKGESGVSYTVEARMPEECQGAWGNVQCCAFGQCMAFNNGTYTNSGNANGKIEDLQLHYSLQSFDGSKPTEDASVKAVIYPTANPSDKKEINVNFIAKPAEEVAAGETSEVFGFCSQDGKFFEDGAVISVGYEADELIPGVLTIYEMQSGVYYKGESGVSYTVDAKMPDECQGAWGNVQCCAFGQCMAFNNGTYTNSGNANGKVEDLQLHYSLQSFDGSKPTEDASVKATIYPTANPSDKKEITVNFIAKPAEGVAAGVANVIVDTNAPVQYFNILGVEVKNPQQGQILIRRQGNVAKKVIF